MKYQLRNLQLQCLVIQESQYKTNSKIPTNGQNLGATKLPVPSLSWSKLKIFYWLETLTDIESISIPISMTYLQLPFTKLHCHWLQITTINLSSFVTDILFSWATWKRGCATAVGGGEGWPGRQRGRRTICHRRRDYCGRLPRGATGNVRGLQGGQASW